MPRKRKQNAGLSDKKKSQRYIKDRNVHTCDGINNSILNNDDNSINSDYGNNDNAILSSNSRLVLQSNSW